MTYKLLRHKDFTAEWEKLPVAIRDQFKKKLAKVIEQPHIPKNMLRGDLAGLMSAEKTGGFNLVN